MHHRITVSVRSASTTTLLTTAFGACFGIGNPALAQSAPLPPPSQAGASAESGGVGDIIVTAQRRIERVQDIPASITALSAADLTRAGATSTEDLTLVTPGLNWGRTSAASQPTIRGVGVTSQAPGNESNVAVYIDGVYQPEQFTTLLELDNVQRIEVLKGPQGTLLGRNATGGAISIITRAPSFDWTGSARLTVGGYGYAKISGYLSGPISDEFAMSVSVAHVEDNGYIRNIFQNEDTGRRNTDVIQGKLLWKPSDRARFELIASHTNDYQESTLANTVVGGNSQARRTANPSGIPLAQLIPTEPFTTASEFTPYYRVKQTSVTGKATFSFDTADLSILAARLNSPADTRQDLDASPLNISSNNIDISSRYNIGEIVLSKTGGALTWLLGASGLTGRSLFDPLVSGAIRSRYGQKARAWAAFGEATYNLAPSLRVTGGIRYSWDQKTSLFQSLDATNQPVGTSTSAKKSWDNISMRAVAKYEFAPKSQAYASFTQGFKTGSFNPATRAGALVPAKPETINAYEGGVKADVSRAFRINAALFHADYKDLQAVILTTDPVTGLTSSVFLNADKAKVSGLEATVEYSPLNTGFTFSAGLSLLKARYSSFPNAQIIVPRTIAGTDVPSLDGNRSTTGDVSGNDLVRAPRRTLSLGATYQHELFGGNLTLSGNAFFSAKWFGDITNRLQQGAYEVVNASASWTDKSGRFQLSAFVQNLTDQTYYNSLISTTIYDKANYARPRWIGVTAGVSF